MEKRELLTPSQRKQVYEIPEYMDKRELVRYYTISDEERLIINQQRGAPNRLGFAVQIGYLPFTHLHSRSELKDKSILLTAILADGINLGLVKIADACPGVSYDQLAWVSDWYIRDETYSKAHAEIFDFHHAHPFSTYFGGWNDFFFRRSRF